MFRILNAICQPFCDYISLTVIEPFQTIFPPRPKQTRKPAVARHPAPSVFRTIRRQRKMVSPEGQYVHLSMNNMSVTEHYVRRQASADALADIRPQGYLH